MQAKQPNKERFVPKIRSILALAVCGALSLGAAACGGNDDNAAGGGDQGGGESLSGQITIDGSSTVFPLAQAAAEQFMQQNPNVQITVGQSGTGGGFEKFCAGETDISNASRPIKEEEEKACRDNGVAYEELTVANDGIAVVSNPNLEIDCLSVSELEKMWRPDNTVDQLNRVAPRLPNTKVSLYGPGTDSGTFDFFTEQIVGEEGASRSDYQASEDDNVLVQGIAGDQNGLGYFGFSYYEQNQDKLNLIGIKADDESADCIKPTSANIQSGEYKPLSRPIFMYPSQKALEKPEVEAFFRFILENNDQVTEAAQAVPLTDEQKQQAGQKIDQLTAGGGAAQ